jgi:hypothetical protein
MTQAAQLAQYGANNVGLGFKNRIINGDMSIDQRNAGASVTLTGGQYTLDRWLGIRVGGTSTLAVQQSTVAPTGFTNSLLVTAGSGATPSGTEERSLNTRIEGFNVADLAWGTANAAPVTLSFWVRSSVTGTFGVVLGNGGFNRSFVTSYTINAANTFEYKTITVPGDTSGTWLTNNGIGLSVYWDLGVGTTYSGSATGSWQGSGFEGLTGGTKLSATSGATWYMTGVQLEKGTVATSFDYLPYGTELALCQRYFCSSFPIGSAVVNGVTTGQVSSSVIPYNTAGSYTNNMNFPVAMRATPTIVIYSTGQVASSTNFEYFDGTWRQATSSPTYGVNSFGFRVEPNGSFTAYVPRIGVYSFSANAEL